MREYKKEMKVKSTEVPLFALAVIIILMAVFFCVLKFFETSSDDLTWFEVNNKTEVRTVVDLQDNIVDVEEK